MPQLDTFQERLKSARKQLDLSQAAFAELSGVSPNTQYGYEKGSSEPTINYLQKLYASGIDINQLVTGHRTLTPAGVSEVGTKLITWLDKHDRDLEAAKIGNLLGQLCQYATENPSKSINVAVDDALKLIEQHL